MHFTNYFRFNTCRCFLCDIARNITSSIMGAIRDYTTKFQEIRLITFYLKMFYKQKCRAWKKEIWVSYWMLIDR